MEQEENRRNMSERAMYYGTIFGAIMIFANISYILGLQSSLFSTLFLGLTIASPFIAGRLVIAYRRREQENLMTFSQAWYFLLIMYACAAILTAIAQFIYFSYIDGGYFMETILQQFTLLQETPGIDATLKEQLGSTAELLKGLGTRELVLQFFSTNIVTSPFITIIIAIFVKKNK